MFKRALTAISIGIALTLSTATAFAACGCTCEAVMKCLGCNPTGCQIKSYLGVNTILFHDDVRYSYACTETSANTAMVIFVPAKLDPISTRPWLGPLYNNGVDFSPTYQLPSFIKVNLVKQCDGSLLAKLPL